MWHKLNRYQNYEIETNNDAYEYEKRQCEREEIYWRNLDREIDREYFGDRDEF
jgi:hypothetical protein